MELRRKNMADGMIGLKCRVCKNEYWFAKYRPLNFYTHKSSSQFDEHFNKHKDCMGETNWQDVKDLFELIYD